MIKLLIDQKVKINAVDNAGKTAIFYAEKYGHLKIREYLKLNGGKTNTSKPVIINNQKLNKKLKTGEAMIWYLHSCGWGVKTKNHLLIFDYWEAGKKPDEPSLLNGYIDPEKIKDESVYVFVSHHHQDHFDPVIFKWGKTIKKIKYIFGWNLKKKPGSYLFERTRNI